MLIFWKKNLRFVDDASKKNYVIIRITPLS